MTMKSFDLLPDTITAPRTDPIYNCHAYLTKVPVGAIKPFIDTFCEKGGIVADIFAGSGMTGLAALSVGRDAKLSDISALGQHIAKGYLQNMPASDLKKVGKQVIDNARSAMGDLYQTKRATDGDKQEMIRAVWSFTYICPSCNHEMVYFDHLDEKGKAPGKCPSCDGEFVRRLWGRGKDVPVRIVVNGEEKKQVEQNVSDEDIKRIQKAAKDKRQKEVPTQSIDKSREMYSRSGLGKAGMTETSMFFSPRNAIALLELWTAINEIKDSKIKQKLRFAFTAILPRASKRYQWSPKRPLNAQNQTYYIAPVYYEWNVFELFERKINASVKANAFLFGDETTSDDKVPNVTYTLASADKLKHLEDASIDYVFTDPPFGSNIFYSDMNLFHEAWLGKTTNHKSEAVVHTTGKKKTGAQERYETLLRDAFKEAYRVLKPDTHMSVVFGNSSGKIWGLVQRAMRDAGFKSTPVHVAILDKGQRSVKGLNSGSEGVVTVDLVMTVQKPNKGESADDGHQLSNGDTAKLIRAAIKELSSNEAQNPSHVYARILRKAIQEHIILDELHLGDVLIALRNAGYSIDRKTGKLYIDEQGIKSA
jgi:16S rRNA G966 N2-methylase RsmD